MLSQGEIGGQSEIEDALVIKTGESKYSEVLKMMRSLEKLTNPGLTYAALDELKKNDPRARQMFGGRDHWHGRIFIVIDRLRSIWTKGASVPT